MIPRSVALTAAFLLFTVLLGWWAVPILGLIWGIVGARTPWAPLIAGLSAAAAWALLLAWSAALGPVGTLVTKLGSVAQMPGGIFLAATLLLPFLLAASAAGLTRR